MTDEYSLEMRRSFLFSVVPILQLAFAEYVYNFLPDLMPAEASTLGIDGIISTSYSTMCDQFRERSIRTGEEPWESMVASANMQASPFPHHPPLPLHTCTHMQPLALCDTPFAGPQMDKLIRNMRMGPAGVHGGGREGSNDSHHVVPMCTPSLPKKRRHPHGSSILHGQEGGMEGGEGPLLLMVMDEVGAPSHFIVSCTLLTPS